LATLYLDGDDEITTAVARVRAADGPEVALVLPPGSRIGTSRINFRLLQREALDSDREVVIVTGDAGVRAVAVSAGLVAYASVAEYERRLDAPSMARLVEAAQPAGPESVRVVPRAARSPRRGRRGLVALLLVGVLGVGGAGAAYVLPSATITLVPRLEAVGPVERTIVADPGVTVPDLGNGVVPAQTVEVPLEASDSFDASGIKVDETSATGQVTFTNNDTSASRSIAAGSIVKTASGIEFRTVKAVVVPRAAVPPPSFVPGKASVGVQAVVAGLSGNVAANTITKVPSGSNPLGLLRVTNTAATSGGTHAETKQVTQADVDAAVTALTATVQSQLETAVAAPATAPAGATLIAETATVGETHAEPATASLVGAEVETFVLSLTATGTILAVESAPLEAIADSMLQAAVPNGSQLQVDSVARVIGKPLVQAGTVTFVVHVSGQSWRALDPPTLLASVVGRSVAAARTTLEAFGTVTIETWPGYVDSIPTLAGRATLSVLTPVPVSTP
jgi:hypothetical protein